jgi:hypothetical protein
MDDDTEELLNLICARIGIIMGDASVIELSIGVREPGERLGEIAKLEAASSQIAAFTAAARSLVD